MEVEGEGVFYGDVSGDSVLSAYDASLVLRYVVGNTSTVNATMADVSGNRAVSSFDAALILRKVVYPDYLFPIEGGALPKSTSNAPRMLAWSRVQDGWLLRVDDPGGVSAVDLEIELPEGVAAQIAAPAYLAHSISAGVLRIASVLNGVDGAVFTISADGSLDFPPHIRSVSFDEGAIPYGGTILPPAFSLAQNAPNPFNPETVIRYGLPATGRVTLEICDVNGRLVRTLFSGEIAAGMHEIVWEGRDAAGRAVASGVYVYRLTSAQGTIVRRMALVR